MLDKSSDLRQPDNQTASVPAWSDAVRFFLHFLMQSQVNLNHSLIVSEYVDELRLTQISSTVK